MKSVYGRLLVGMGLSWNLHGACFAQSAPDVEAPLGTTMERVWHLGRTTGDLERIMQFYVDLLGLGLRGERNAPIPFYTVDAINEFVGGPKGAEFRAAFMPIPGTSSATEPGEQIYLEAFEYRHIDRKLAIPSLVDVGVSNLRFVVRDLDALIAAAAAADVAFISVGEQPVAVAAPVGYSGSARAVMIRDPDGYPVELLEFSPSPPSLAPEDSSILGAQMVVVVDDLEESLELYRSFVDAELEISEATAWANADALEQLRGIPAAEYRSASLLLPGSAIRLELLEFRGVEQQTYRPVFQDIGFGHVAFLTKDIEVVYEKMNELQMRSVSASGTWTQINAGTRAIYTRDHDGFFMEVIERR
jgi:catechol 2,3-dioxygenase-like lactoylglutathione lyase family enzyme